MSPQRKVARIFGNSAKSGKQRPFARELRKLGRAPTGQLARDCMTATEDSNRSLFHHFRKFMTMPMSYLHDAGEPPVAAGASGPIFDLVCAPGRCAPFADNQCRTVLRRATLDAIALANNAADKLSADNPDPETTRLFRAFFGHDPSRPIPWADNQPSRLSVASRFRSCARELNGGRRTHTRASAPRTRLPY